MGKTERQFWSDIDYSLGECGIDPYQVEDLVRRHNASLINILDYIREHRAKPDAELTKGCDDLLLELHRLTAPVFTRLRQRGYTKYDLTG